MIKLFINSIKMPNDKIIDLLYIENLRDGAFEIDSTTKNDYNYLVTNYWFCISHRAWNLIYHYLLVMMFTSVQHS